MKYSKFLFLLLLASFPSLVFSQAYSTKDMINQYDPFTITLNDFTLSTNDEDFKDNYNFVIVVTVTAGNEKVIKFLSKDDILINNIKVYDDLSQVNMTARKNNVFLLPALFNLPNSPGAITMKIEGYSNVHAIDLNVLNQMSTSFTYVSAFMFDAIEHAYKYVVNTTEVNRPNTQSLTNAEVLQQNIKTRPDVFYLGNPIEITYVIPQDPKKAIGSNILVQGKRPLESAVGKYKDVVNITFNKLTDVKIVQSEPYYKKVQGVFLDLTGQTLISPDKREGFIEKAQDLISNDLVPGLKQGVYINDQVSKQYINLLNLIKAGVRVKSDSLQTTNDMMKSDEREALSYFEQNLKDNDFNLDNQYLFDDYISSSVNRGIIQKEIDLIRRYYQIK